MRKKLFFCLAGVSITVFFAYELKPDESVISQYTGEESTRTSESSSKLKSENHHIALHSQHIDTANAHEPLITSDTAGDQEKSLQDIAKLRPAHAAQIALNSPPNLRLKYLSLVIETWSEQDFNAAWSWSENAGENTFYLRKIMIGKLCLKEPEKIAELTRQWSASQPLQANDIYDLAIFSLVETKSFYLAAQLTQQSPLPADDRTSALRSVANDWADQNPTEAAQWALQKEGETHDIALVAVVDRWINSSPLHAAEFVNSLPESAQKSELMQEVFSRWLAMDQSSVNAWRAANGVFQP